MTVVGLNAYYKLYVWANELEKNYGNVEVEESHQQPRPYDVHNNNNSYFTDASQLQAANLTTAGAHINH